MRVLTLEEKNLLRDLEDEFNKEAVSLGLNPFVEVYVKKNSYSEEKNKEYFKLGHIKKIKGLYKKFGIDSVECYWANARNKSPEVDLFIKNLIPCEGADGQCMFDCPRYKECVVCGNLEDF